MTKLLLAALFAGGLAAAPPPDIAPPVPADEEKSAFLPVMPQDVEQILSADMSVIVIDVRSKAAYDHSHIKGALNVPLQEVEDGEGMPFRKEDKIVLYCSCPKGGIAAKAARILAEEGYENLWVMLGGIQAWTGETESNY